MAEALELAARRSRLGWAAAAVLLLWLYFTAVYTWAPGGLLSAGLELLPGLLGVSLLILVMGFRPQDCYLRPARISGKGLLALGLFLLALVPVLLPARWAGWDWQAGLVSAPLSGLGQELFFRSSLLPVMMRLVPRPGLALLLHAVLFALWHVPLALRTAPLGGAIAVTVVTFTGGLVWGWQVQHDRTVYWAMGQHMLYLVVMSLFTWG